MIAISLPDRNGITSENQKYAVYFEERLGAVPNLYLMMMHADEALNSYYHLLNRRQEFTIRECELISLVVANINGSPYCLESHSMIARLNGFTEEQIEEMKGGTAAFDPRLDALARFARGIVLTRGRPDAALLEAFFAAGYSTAHLVDLVMSIGYNTIANLLAAVTHIPPDE